MAVLPVHGPAPSMLRGEPMSPARRATTTTGAMLEVAQATTAGQQRPPAAGMVLGATTAPDGAFVVVLPYPPSVNHLWRRVGNRTLLSAEGRDYHHRVELLVLLGRSRGYRVPEPPHRVTLLATPPDRRRRDLDNLTKAVFDPVYRGLELDDSVIDWYSIGWNRDGGKARIEVRIEPLPARRPGSEEG